MQKFNYQSPISLVLGNALSITLPTILLIIALGTMIWFIVELKRKRLQLKAMVVWFSLNVLYTTTILYVFIISILQTCHVAVFNIFTLIAYYVFGLQLANNMEWIFLLIFGFITFVLIKSMLNSLRIARLDDRIDELNQEVAILRGKVNQTTNFNNLPLPSMSPSPKEIKSKIKNQLRNIRVELKAEKKLNDLKLKYKPINDLEIDKKINDLNFEKNELIDNQTNQLSSSEQTKALVIETTDTSLNSD